MQLLIAHNLSSIRLAGWPHARPHEDANFGSEFELLPSSRNIRDLSQELKPRDGCGKTAGSSCPPIPRPPPEKRPADDAESSAVLEIEQELKKMKDQLADPAVAPPYIISPSPKTGEDFYFQPILARPYCVTLPPAERSGSQAERPRWESAR